MRHTFRPAWPYLWRYRRGLRLGLLAILLMELVAVGLPLLIRSGVDALTRGGSLRTVLALAALMLAAAAFFDWRRAHKLTMGHGVWIGHGAVILPGVMIGTGAAGRPSADRLVGLVPRSAERRAPGFSNLGIQDFIPKFLRT